VAVAVSLSLSPAPCAAVPVAGRGRLVLFCLGCCAAAAAASGGVHPASWRATSGGRVGHRGGSRGQLGS
jgi:hypothetical protein